MFLKFIILLRYFLKIENIHYPSPRTNTPPFFYRHHRPPLILSLPLSFLFLSSFLPPPSPSFPSSPLFPRPLFPSLSLIALAGGERRERGGGRKEREERGEREEKRGRIEKREEEGEGVVVVKGGGSGGRRKKLI